MASTMAETKCQFYCYDNTPVKILEERGEKSLNVSQMMIRMPLTRKNSSRIIEKSLKMSQMSAELRSEDNNSPSLKLNFNLKKVRMMFSSVEYIIT